MVTKNIRFNHQTVYRLLSREKPLLLARLIVSITKRCTDCFFLSFSTTLKTNCFNHQTVYRLLSIIEGSEIAEFLFQSPNGVQIALKPRGSRSIGHIVVSITKRCTDCFHRQRTMPTLKESFNHQAVYRLL